MRPKLRSFTRSQWAKSRFPRFFQKTLASTFVVILGWDRALRASLFFAFKKENHYVKSLLLITMVYKHQVSYMRLGLFGSWEVVEVWMGVNGGIRGGEGPYVREGRKRGNLASKIYEGDTPGPNGIHCHM